MLRGRLRPLGPYSVLGSTPRVGRLCLSAFSAPWPLKGNVGGRAGPSTEIISRKIFSALLFSTRGCARLGFCSSARFPVFRLPWGPVGVYHLKKKFFFRLFRLAAGGSAALRFRSRCRSTGLLVLPVLGRSSPVRGPGRPVDGNNLAKDFFCFFAGDCARAAFRVWPVSGFSGRPAPPAPFSRPRP